MDVDVHGESDDNVVVLAIDRGVGNITLVERDASRAVIGVDQLGDLDEERIVFVCIDQRRSAIAGCAADLPKVRTEIENALSPKFNTIEEALPP